MRFDKKGLCAALCLLGACATGKSAQTQPPPPPLDKAASDLACPRAELSVQAIGDSQLRIRGCGKQQVYILLKEGWVANTLDQGGGGPPAAK